MLISVRSIVALCLCVRDHRKKTSFKFMHSWISHTHIEKSDRVRVRSVSFFALSPKAEEECERFSRSFSRDERWLMRSNDIRCITRDILQPWAALSPHLHYHQSAVRSCCCYWSRGEGVSTKSTVICFSSTGGGECFFFIIFFYESWNLVMAENASLKSRLFSRLGRRPTFYPNRSDRRAITFWRFGISEKIAR